MQVDNDGISRRSRIDRLVPVELSIREAMRAVEDAGAHPLLTDAIILLEQAGNKVADWVELKTADNMLADEIRILRLALTDARVAIDALYAGHGVDSRTIDQIDELLGVPDAE